MYQDSFGTNKPAQVRFNNESEYYKALGFLAKSISDFDAGLTL